MTTGSPSYLTHFLNRWGRSRFAFPFFVLLAVSLILASEETYRQTTSTLRGGIELTDARIQSLRLLQMLSEAEAAELQFLTLQDERFPSQLAKIKQDIPQVLGAVTVFLEQQSTEGAASALRVATLTRQKIAQLDEILRLANADQLAAATTLARDPQMRDDMLGLRDELNTQLAQATVLQQQVRTSIYDALLLSRAAIGLLTLFILATFFLIFRHLHRQEIDSGRQATFLTSERARLESEVKRRTIRLTELASHLQTVIEHERAHIARELHDELGGLLTVCKLEIARARAKVGGDPAEVRLRLERINEHLNQGIALKRKIIEDLRPSSLADLGLTVALENLCNDMSESLAVPVALATTEFDLSPEASLAVYRFVQEALTNIGKYARASQVEVTLSVVGDSARVEVYDNGEGFDIKTPRTGHHGLSGMRFRAESMGGSMRLTSTPGLGTTVSIEFPQHTNRVLNA